MFALLDFLSTIMPIVCVLCLVALIVLLVLLIVFKKKKKDTEKIKKASLIGIALSIVVMIVTAVSLNAYGKAAYEQSEDYQNMQNSIDKTQEIISRYE